MGERHLIYGPVVFAVVGGAAGVSAAMLFRYDAGHDRVHIEDSLPLVVAGALVGAALGRLVAWAHLRYPAGRPGIEVVATALLLGGGGAVLGWLWGDKRDRNPPAEMGWGLMGGLVLGAGLGAVGSMWDRHRPRACPTAPAPRINGLRVVTYSSIDSRHRFTGANEHRVVDVTEGEVLFGPVAGLAIGAEAAGGGVVLFGCDEDWRPVWETPCTTVAAAQAQAEFEYEGVSRTWVPAAQ